EMPTEVRGRSADNWRPYGARIDMERPCGYRDGAAEAILPVINGEVVDCHGGRAIQTTVHLPSRAVLNSGYRRVGAITRFVKNGSTVPTLSLVGRSVLLRGAPSVPLDNCAHDVGGDLLSPNY